MTDYSKYIWHNGEIIPWDDAKIHVMSHVLHYGSGVFEGIKCYNTVTGPQIFRLEDHIDRLFRSAESYQMNITTPKEKIIDGCKDVVNANNLKECYIRPIVFYGYDTLGVDPKQCPLNISIASFYWGAYLGEEGVINGVNVTVSPYQKFSYKSMPSTAKASGQYMNSMLSVTDARQRGYDEALLLNSEGNVAEGSGQNIFYVKNNTVYTNDENSSILLGITRASIIEICNELNIPVEIRNFNLEDLLVADEIFFTGTASEVTPIKSLQDNLVSNGEPGKITLKLREYYMDVVNAKNNKFLSWLSPLNDKSIAEQS